MKDIEIIKNYFYSANKTAISIMYLDSYAKDSSLKSYSSGHLGTSMSTNFILANLYYFLNKEKISNQVVVGSGHAGLSLITNLWLNGTLVKYYPKYSLNKEGLNNLIKDFGFIVRSEINPGYPETIYDGGELGYSLATSYGYALNNPDVSLIPCLIGDGEAETGTLNASWQLNKLLELDSKVLPIINLNGLKMTSESFLSLFTNEELINYFKLYGYDVFIVDAHNKDIDVSIKEMQDALKNSQDVKKPLIIFKSLKGYTLPIFEGNPLVHKDPLSSFDKDKKEKIVRLLWNNYPDNLFDRENNLLSYFSYFQNTSPLIKRKNVEDINTNNNLSTYLKEILSNQKRLIFSPDEITSNKLGSLKEYTFELLNENVLQALYLGYAMAGNLGFYISYEGFMPLISSMIMQYDKYLRQKDYYNVNKEIPSLNYILTSTYLENTYSHQNPSFVNNLLLKSDDYYNIIYPVCESDLVKEIEKHKHLKDTLNIYISSKRHQKEYSLSSMIDIVIKNANPDLVLVATGDYMLDVIMEAYHKLKDTYKIQVVYVKEPKILDIKSRKALTSQEFNYYFPACTPIIYGFMGYPLVINALMSERGVNFTTLGYQDNLSFGGKDGVLTSNNCNVNDIIEVSKDKVRKRLK